jgi:HrpA-like RNA helicase
MNIMTSKENLTAEFAHLKPVIESDESDLLPFVGYDLGKTARDQLPIYGSQREILYLLKMNDALVLSGEPGSGKTSQVPQILYNARYASSDSSICIVLPSKISVISSAHRVAGELRTEIGLGVGYSYKYNSKFSKYSRIKFITYYSLLREIQLDPLLRCYSVVILDDYHERSIEQDISLFLMRRILRKRKVQEKPLKLVVMSATLEIEAILNYIEGCEKESEVKLSVEPFQIQKTSLRVKMFYLTQSVSHILDYAIKLTAELHLAKPLDQDLLIFLPSAFEIERYAAKLKEHFDSHNMRNFIIVKLHSKLKIVDQMKIFEPRSNSNTSRRIIASTSIAETGVTIEQVSIVIDTLMEKIQIYDHLTNSYKKKTVFISKFTAKQRAGRVGRVKDGECYRLATDSDFNRKLICNSVPQIAYSNLDFFYIYMRSVEVKDFYSLNLPSPFDKSSLLKTLENLYALKIIDLYGDLTFDLGVFVARLPLESKLSVMLLNSYRAEFSCSEEISMVVSLLSAGNVFSERRDSGSLLKFKKTFGAKEGDILTLINLFIYYKSISTRDKKQFCIDNLLNEYVLSQAEEIKNKIDGMMNELGKVTKSSADDSESILRCVCSALFANVAQSNPDGTYKLLANESVSVTLHPSSISNTNYPRWVIYYSLDGPNDSDSKVYIRELSQIRVEWLTELIPDYFEDTQKADIELQRQKDLKEREVAETKKVKEVTIQAAPKIPISFIKAKQPISGKQKNIISMLHSDEEI